MFILYSINNSYKSQHYFITIYKLYLTVSFPPKRSISQTIQKINSSAIYNRKTFLTFRSYQHGVCRRDLLNGDLILL